MRGIRQPVVVCAVVALCAAGLRAAAVTPAPKRAAPLPKWELKFTENFDGTALNPKLWRRIEGQADAGADWQRNISLRDDLVTVKGGCLYLKGVRNDDLSADSRRVLAGGISTQGLFEMTYGKIEARIRLESCPGAWPAVWMMPERPSVGWPHCGEIDILEHLNGDPFVYQTVHSGWTAQHPNDPPRGGKGAIRLDGWNVYALEWTPEKIVWRVNGAITHAYEKVGDDPARWPWDAPFYLMLDMQLGGSWVGPVDESALPVTMQVDWVKFYRLVRGGKRVSVFSRPKK